MLPEMQHRYDRLLEAPRTAPTPRPTPSQSEQPVTDMSDDILQVRVPRGQRKLTQRPQRALRDKHQRGVPVPALMEEYGISRASVFRYLRSDKRAGGAGGS